MRDSGGPLTLESLRAAWPEIVAAAKAEKPMLASALEDTAPVACDGAAVRLQALGGNPMTVEGLTRSRASIEAIMGRIMGASVRVGLGDAPAAPRNAPAGPAPAAVVKESPTPPAPPQRVTATGARAERLKALRQKDPTLDSAMDSLDLELLD